MRRNTKGEGYGYHDDHEEAATDPWILPRDRRRRSGPLEQDWRGLDPQGRRGIQPRAALPAPVERRTPYAPPVPRKGKRQVSAPARVLIEAAPRRLDLCFLPDRAAPAQLVAAQRQQPSLSRGFFAPPALAKWNLSGSCAYFFCKNLLQHPNHSRVNFIRVVGNVIRIEKFRCFCCSIKIAEVARVTTKTGRPPRLFLCGQNIIKSPLPSGVCKKSILHLNSIFTRPPFDCGGDAIYFV